MATDYLVSMATKRVLPIGENSIGLPTIHSPDRLGRDPTDWEQVVPPLLDEIASGMPVVRALRKLGIPHNGDVWRKLVSDRWRTEYQESRRAGALARVDRSHDRLLQLAEDAQSGEGTVTRESIDAARWEAEHSKWAAERSDPESWGKEDRVKIASVSAIRVIIETPPEAAQLPPIPYVAELPVTQTPHLLKRGE